MADGDKSDPLWMLTPEERAYLREEGKTPVPSPQTTQSLPVPAASSTIPSSPSQSDWLNTRLHWFDTSGIDSALAPYLMPSQGAHDRATALVGGAYETLGNAAQNVAGITPPALPPADQASVAAHPYYAGAGNVVGGAAATAPLIVGSEALAPVAAALPGVARLYNALNPVVQSAVKGAGAGAWQNALTGDPNEALWKRGGLGAVIGGTLGAATGKVADWLGAFKTLEPEVAQAAKTAQSEGITNIGTQNLPGGSIKAMGAVPDRATGQQINNATSKILGLDLPDYTAPNLAKAKTTLGQAVTKAANSGSIDVNAPLSSGGPNLDTLLTQIQNAAQRNNVGADIGPIINDIRSKVVNGKISGQDFDNLVGNGSVLHDLVGSENAYVKNAAQTLDSAMDAAFKVNSPPGAYDNWVDARTKYRLLMGLQANRLPNGYINPTTLFNSIQSRFTDLKGTPVSSSPVVGRMGALADAVRTLYGGGNPPPSAGSGSFFRNLATGAGFAGGSEGLNYLLGGGVPNAAHLLAPQVLIPAVIGAGAAGLRYLGSKYQGSQPFVNALISRGGRAAGDAVAPWVGAAGTAAAPGRVNP